MPITQKRMLSVLSAAEDYRQALIAAQDLLRISRQRVTDGKLSPTDALEYLSQFIEPSLLLHDPIHSHATILVEQRHFKSHARRNEASARRQARKRQSQFAIPSSTPAHYTIHPSHLPEPTPVQDEEPPIFQIDLESDTLPEKEELF